MTVTRLRGDGGQLLPLAAGFALVAALGVTVVVDASAAFLAHRALASVADGAALAAAQQVDLAAYYAGDGDLLPLGDVAGAAAAYVERHGPGAELVAVTLVDGRTAVEVVVRRRVAFRLAVGVLPGSATVEATATARLRAR